MLPTVRAMSSRASQASDSGMPQAAQWVRTAIGEARKLAATPLQTIASRANHASAAPPRRQMLQWQ